MKNRYVNGVDDEDARHRHPGGASSAARTGPTTRVPFIIAELRLIAPGRSWRCTSSGIDDWNAGALSALAIPMQQLRGEQRPDRGIDGDAVGHEEREDRRQRLHRELQLLLRHSVGEHAGGDRQHEQRAELHEHHHADECRASGAVVDVGRQREVLHPRADVRQREADEDDPEAAVRQGRSGGARLVAVLRAG